MTRRNSVSTGATGGESPRGVSPTEIEIDLSSPVNEEAFASAREPGVPRRVPGGAGAVLKEEGRGELEGARKALDFSGAGAAFTTEDLIGALRSESDESKRIERLSQLFSRQQVTEVSAENLIKILSVFEDEPTKANVVGEWFREKKDVKNLVEILQVLNAGLDGERDPEKIRKLGRQISGIAEKWFATIGTNVPLQSPSPERFQRKAPDLEKIFSLVPALHHSEVANAWLKKNNSAENVVKILPKIDPTKRISFAQDWLTKSRNSDADFVTICSGMETELGGKEGQFRFLQEWFGGKENNLNLETVQSFFEQLPSISKYEKQNFLEEEWLLNKNNSAESLIQLLPIYQTAAEQVLIVKKWLRKSGKNTLENVVKILPHIVEASGDEGKKVVQKALFAIEWVRENHTSFDGLKKIIDCLERSGRRREVIDTWFDKEENNTVENLLKVLPEGGPETLRQLYRQRYAEQWLYKKFRANPEKRCEVLIPLMKAGVFEKYGDTLLQLVKDFNGKSLCNFCAEVYENDSVRNEWIGYFIDRGRITRDNLEDLQKPFGKIESRRDAVDFLGGVKAKLRLTNREVLEITKGKAEPLKDFYENVLGEQNRKPLADVLNGAGIARVTTDFGAENLAGIRLSDLATYYDSISNEEGHAGVFFDTCLKPEIREQIKTDYKPHYEQAYISSAEASLLQMITGYELTRVGMICDALSSKMPAIPTGATTCRINFDNVAEFDEVKKREITESFERILQTPAPTKEVVSAFFQTVLGLEDGLSEAKKQDFLNLYKQNKDTLAHFFAQENGMRDFQICATSRADGCYANLANQLGSALNNKLFEQSHDKYLPILYSCFSEKLAVPILRSNWALHDSSNPLTNEKVKAEFFYPAGLLADLEKEFCGEDGKIKRDPYEIIQEKLRKDCSVGAEQSREAAHEFFGSDNKKAAKLAALIVLEKTLSELFRHQSLAGAKDFLDEEIAKMMSVASTTVSRDGAAAAGIRRDEDGGVSESKDSNPILVGSAVQLVNSVLARRRRDRE